MSPELCINNSVYGPLTIANVFLLLLLLLIWSVHKSDSPAPPDEYICCYCKMGLKQIYYWPNVIRSGLPCSPGSRWKPACWRLDYSCIQVISEWSWTGCFHSVGEGEKKIRISGKHFKKNSGAEITRENTMTVRVLFAGFAIQSSSLYVDTTLFGLFPSCTHLSF